MLSNYAKYFHMELVCFKNLAFLVFCFDIIVYFSEGFVLVFEYMQSDLSELIYDAERPLSPAHIKSFMQMLLKGVAFMHEHNIMHRV